MQSDIFKNNIAASCINCGALNIGEAKHQTKQQKSSEVELVKVELVDNDDDNDNDNDKDKAKDKDKKKGKTKTNDKNKDQDKMKIKAMRKPHGRTSMWGNNYIVY